jgi:hypothetical protein
MNIMIITLLFIYIIKGKLMEDSKQCYEEWDKIFEQQEQYKKENPHIKNNKRSKTYIDEDGVVRCTKCGSTDDISGCMDCTNEKEYLNSKK